MKQQAASSDFHLTTSGLPHRLASRGLNLFLAVLIILSSSCASNKHKPHKKLKPGKPIPCPMKDC